MKFVESEKLRIIEDLALRQAKRQKRRLVLWQYFENKLTRTLAVAWGIHWAITYILGGIDYKTLMFLAMIISFVWSFRRAIGKTGAYRK